MAARTLFCSVVVVVVVVMLAPAAHASAAFPGSMHDHLTADSFAPCTVCHTTNAGGFGTITKAFGQAMQAEGLVAGDEASLTAALDALDAAGTDSDSDGISDVDELRAGTDPNVANIGEGEGEPPLQYGFGCAAASGAAPPCVALAAALLARRRRR